MEVYIDKANFISLTTSKSSDAYVTEDCRRMLQNHCDLYFLFPKEEIKDANSEVKMWITKMTQGFKGKVLWNVDFPYKPLKANIHTHFSQNKSKLSAIYLLDDEKTNALKNNGLMLFVPVGEEIEKLSSLFFNDYQFTKTIDTRHELTRWEDISTELSPCTDIVITDKYIFSFEDLYSHNIYELVAELCRHAKQSKINIVFFTLKENYDKRSKVNFIPDWRAIRSNIKSAVKKVTKCEPNVTFVTAGDHNLGEHDRTIFTNYKHIKSGDTFNYFDSKGRLITKGRSMDILSLASIENQRKAFAFIEDMQRIIDKIKRINSDNIIGDKESNYLKLS